MNSADKKVFRDPIHSLIEFDKSDDWGLLKVIQSSWFQRLRDVKQTGFVYYVYPSAHHTRFEHSLGACAMMKKVLDALFYPSSIGYELANGKLIKLNEKGIRGACVIRKQGKGSKKGSERGENVAGRWKP